MSSQISRRRYLLRAAPGSIGESRHTFLDSIATLHLAYGFGFLAGLIKFRSHWSTPASALPEFAMRAMRFASLTVTSEWPTPENPLFLFLTQQVEFLRKAGAEVEVFFFRGAKNPLNYLKALWRFNRAYRNRSSFDVVHAQFGQAGLIPWPKRWPLVVTFHGTDMLGQLSPKGEMTWQGRLLVRLSQLVSLAPPTPFSSYQTR